MLQRIYGTAWETEEQLKAYLHFKEEAKRRDHRRLGKDLDLFSIQVQISSKTIMMFLLVASVMLLDFVGLNYSRILAEYRMMLGEVWYSGIQRVLS